MVPTDRLLAGELEVRLPQQVSHEDLRLLVGKMHAETFVQAAAEWHISMPASGGFGFGRKA